MSHISQDCTILHSENVLFSYDPRLTSCRDKDVTYGRRLANWQDFIPIHVSLQCPHRINFSNIHFCSESICSLGNASSNPSISCNDDPFAGKKKVHGPEVAINRALSCPIPVVKHVFCVGVVDRNNWVSEFLLLLQGLEPDDSSRGFLSPAQNTP